MTDHKQISCKRCGNTADRFVYDEYRRGYQCHFCAVDFVYLICQKCGINSNENKDIFYRDNQSIVCEGCKYRIDNKKLKFFK